MKWWTVIAWVLMVITTQEVAGSRILFITALGSAPHELFFQAIANTLANHGHQITFVSPYKPTKVRKNIRDVVIRDLESVKELIKENPNSEGDSMVIADASPELCCDALGKKEVQDLLKEEFDLGLISSFMSDCFLSLFYQLKIPHISVCPSEMIIGVSLMMGNPPFPSFVNSPAYHVTHPFTFVERFYNTIINCIVDARFRNSILPRVDAECRRRGLCPESMPSIEQMQENASLLLINSVKTVEVPPRPHVPSIVHCGGIHCKDPKPLPKDLEKWVSGSGTAGFIFISFGTSVGSANLPEPYRKLLMEVLGSLHQRVLWKFDQETMEDLPPNVRIHKKLPTQDLLGDPRLRVFITAGEPLSTMASMYHGKPVLGLPAFRTQLTNMKEVQRQGWGRFLFWEETTTHILKNTILGLMVDRSINEEVRRRSILMHDVPQTPEQEINYWVDYVIRHKGALHLRSPILSMSWYEVYNVDVWLLVIGISVALVYIFTKLFLFFFRCCCSVTSKPKRD